MRTLIVIVALGVIGAFGCATAPSAPEQQESTQSHLFGWGKSYKSSGSSDTTSYKSSGASNTSSGGPVQTGLPPEAEAVPEQDDTPLGAYGDSCSVPDDCASHVCSPDGDGVLYCSN
jgi:hypothetical protein